MLKIDHRTSRRFVLDTQALWPGRRCHSSEGVTKRLRAKESPCLGM
jgi:hypothetical protein